MIEEFHKKSNFDISLERLKEVCRYPWKYLKNNIESGELTAVRFKYIGIFQVYLGRARYMLKKLEKDYNLGKIEKYNYVRIKNMLTKYLNSNEKKD